MIDYETYVRIRNYFIRDGLNYSQIADELALDHRTVARWANETQFLPRRSAKKPSKLDLFKNDIVRLKKFKKIKQVSGKIKAAA